MSDITYTIPTGKQDFKHLSRLLLQAFLAPLTAESNYIKAMGLDNFRVLRRGNQLIGGLVLIEMGQWFESRKVPITGIASVAVAPECRGGGSAFTLMRHTLEELHNQGVAISVLYPAVQGLYRKLGYEQAGYYCGWELETRAIPLQKPMLSIEPIEPQMDGLRSLQQRHAQHHNGHLDRATGIWKLLLESPMMQALFAYRFGSAEQPEGYILFKQERTREAATLSVQDWALLTPAAVQTWWAFLAHHGVQIDRVKWQGAPIEPLTFLLNDWSLKSAFQRRWMLRIIDVPTALVARGYPPHCETALHLHIEDELLSANTGNFVLSVAQGRGHVQPGGRGDVCVNIQHLAPLYTGLFSAQQLRLLGKLEGADEGVSIANQLFGGSVPWMPDFF